ncbi:MAG: hypothetical protein V7644_1503 [Actinomycetota bacterium]|jgi:hypothetical protein
MSKARLLSLLVTASLLAIFIAKVMLVVTPDGMNDGGFW